MSSILLAPISLLFTVSPIALAQTATLHPSAQPEDPKIRAQAVRLLELAVQASTPTSVTNVQLVTRFHLNNPGPGEVSDGEHIVTVGSWWKLRRNEWNYGSTHLILVRNGDLRQRITPEAPLPPIAEVIDNTTPIDLVEFDRTDLIRSIERGPQESLCISFDSIAGDRQQAGLICVDREKHWLMSKKIGDALTVNSRFVPFNGAFMPAHVEHYVGNMLQ